MPSPEQDHRASAWRLWEDADENVTCILAGRPGHVCTPPISETGEIDLQCHHVIPAQTLRRLWERAAFYRHSPSPTMEPPAWYALMWEVTADDLVADGRNSVFVCETAHRQLEGQRYLLPVLPHAIAFADEYLIPHALPLFTEPELTDQEEHYAQAREG